MSYLITSNLFEWRSIKAVLYYNNKHLLQLHNNCALVREGSSFPRNGIPMGVSVLAVAHLDMKCTKQFVVVKLDFIPCLIFNPCMAATTIYGLIEDTLGSHDFLSVYML